jgi:hypothetical protein
MFAGLVQSGRSTATVAAAAACTFLAAGCATAVSADRPVPRVIVPRVIVMRDNANGRAVSVRAGDSIELILASSYWKVTGSSAPRVVRQDGPTVLLPRPSSCPAIPGLGCTPVRTSFTALSRGEAVIRASRTSCGEALRCGGRATRFTLTVVVTTSS